MIGGAIFILIAWLVEMPKWLSIIMTVYGSIKFIGTLLKVGYKAGNDSD